MTPETALTLFGFTELESRLYVELLRQSPLSGYRLAQIVNKAPANTYQALRALTVKGAVVLAERESDATTYCAVPPVELMASLSQAFEASCADALDSLHGVQTPSTVEQVYQLNSATQAVERAKAMLDGAREIVLFDFFPSVYELMAPHIASAKARGVLVAGVTYDPAHDSPTTPFSAESLPVFPMEWPGLGLIIVADGEQKLISQLSRDMTQLLNGVWSDSVFLSCTYHSSLACEIRLAALKRDPSDPLQCLSLGRSQPPGLRTILQQGR